MKHQIYFAVIFILSNLISLNLLAHSGSSSKNTKPYVVLLGPNNLNQVRVNVENYEPNGKDVKKFEINFGDGVKVTNKKDVIHQYLNNGTYTLTIKTWDSKNTVNVYTQALDISTQYQVQTIPNTVVLGPVSLNNNQKYKLELTTDQVARLYKVTVFRNTENQKPFKFNRFCKRDYNIEINDIEIFQEDEINCQTTQIERFALLSNKNIIKFEAQEARWRKRFKVQISAVDIIKNLDNVPPVILANVSSNTITNNPKVHISVNDASTTNTYIWNSQNQLVGTTAEKEFDIDLTEGSNSFILQSKDAANNTSAYLYLNDIILDSRAPSLTTVLASEYIYSTYPQNFILSIISDEDLHSLTINNQLATQTAPKTYSYTLQIDRPGTLSLNLKAFDLAGNEKIQDYTVNFSIDNLAPVISSSLASGNVTNQGNIIFSIFDNADTTTEIFQNGQLILTSTQKDISTALVQGQNSFSVISTDSFGNRSPVYELVYIIYDKVAPQLSSSLGENYLFNSFPQDLLINIYSDEELTYAEVDGIAVPVNAASQFSFVKPLNYQGAYSVEVKVKDKAGNLTNKTFNFIVNLDEIKPVISILNVPELTNADYVQAQFQITEVNKTTTSICLNGVDLATVQEKNFTYVMNLAEGENTIEAISTDEAGNVSLTYSKTIFKDTISPILSEILPFDNYRSDQLVVAVSGNSNEKLAQVSVNGAMAVLGPDQLSFSASINFSDFGQKILNIEATDFAGNKTNIVRSVLLKDLEAPVISTNLSNGYMTHNLISVNVTGDDITNLRVLINENEVFNQNATSFESTFIFGEGVEHKVDIFAVNGRGQEAHSSFISILDSQAPFINVFNFATQTTENFVKIDYNYFDVSPSTLRVFVDQQKVFESSENLGSFDVPLLTDGEHIVSVTAIDAAGNMSEPFTFNVYRDSTAPVITLVSPQNNDYVDGTGFKVKFKVDDTQVSVWANDNGVAWDENEQLWYANLAAFSTDDFLIKLRAQNNLGLSSELIFTVKPLLSPLVPELIGMYEDSVNNKLIIRGADGSTRPNLTLNIKKNFFSSIQVQADSKGSFMASLEPKDEYTVFLTDPATGLEYSKKLTRFQQEIILSGRVKDNHDAPLSGVVVSLGAENLQATTDENGVFIFSKAQFPNSQMQGEQKVIISGSSAQSVNISRPHTFSTTTLNVNLSKNNNNIVQDTIYLYPTYLDVDVLSPDNGSGTFTSAEAPGVSLTATGVFPVSSNGASAISVNISMFVVSPDKLSVQPPAEAMPEEVLVLEPSGAVFIGGDMQLTMPNYSNFPAGTTMALLLFNSLTGKWEIGGAGRVTEDGQSVSTKPDQGLRHFSKAYFIPAAPDLLAMNVPDRVGSDSFSGAVTNKIEMPSFKVMGQSVSPSLVYKSSWARPSTTITNVFNFADKEIITSVKEPQVGSVAQQYVVDVVSCRKSLLSNGDFGILLREASRNLDSGGYNRAIENAQNNLAQKNYEGTNCIKSGEQYFYNNFNYVTDPYDLTTKISPKLVEMNLETADIQTAGHQFKNLPAMAQLSKFVELKNRNNQYLATGMYPYIAQYKIFYDKLTTGTVTTKYLDMITGAVVSTETNKPIKTESSYIKDPTQVFGASLIDNIFVQNYRDSEAGQGWKIAGTQKIVNPSSQKIMLEEADGSIATYSVKNSIQTVLDANLISADLTKGVSLNQWPQFVFSEKETSEIKKANWNGQAYAVTNVGKAPEVNGNVSGFTYYDWTERGAQYTIPGGCKTRIFFPGGNACIEFYPDTTAYYELPRSTCKANSYPYKQISASAQYLQTASGTYVLDQARNALSYVQNNNYQDLIFNKVPLEFYIPRISGVKRLRDINDPFSVIVEYDDVQVNNFINQNSGLVSNGARTVLRDQTYQAYNSCGSVTATVPASTGNMYIAGYLNQPSGIIQSINSNLILIANTGSDNILSYNTSDSHFEQVAVVNKPRGLAQDSSGNLYVSSSLGLIHKIDVYGTVTTIAGNPDSGKYLFEGDAQEFKLNSPYGLALDEQTNSLFVADTGYNRIVKIDLAQSFVTTVAGNGQVGFSGDGGSGIDAALSAPTLLHIDANRNLIIVDAGNNRIRSLSLNTASNTELAFDPTTPDHSKLTKKADGTWERTYRSGQKEIFNQQGRHIASVSTNNLTTTYEYDQEKLTKVKFPNNDEINYVYSGDRLNYILDPSNKRTSFDYNYLKQLTKVTYPDNSQKQFEYDEQGLMIQETNQKGFTSRYWYNQFDRLQKVVLGDGTEVKVNDSASNSLAQKDATGVFTPSSAYTNQDTITDAKGNKITFVKDATGYISTIVDPKGRTQKIKRDLASRPIELTDVDNSIVQNKYDTTFGDLIESKNVTLDITTKTSYNIYGQVISETDPFNKTSTKEYNSKLQLIKQTAPDGKFVSYEYNSLSLVTKKASYSAANELKNQIIYEYNSKGQLTKQTDLNNKFASYTYDSSGNVISSTSNIDASTTSVTQYEYDQMNRLIKVISPKNEVTEYTYSLLGELLQIKDPQNKITSFEYNTKGELIRKTDPAGLVYEMTYDKNGNLLTEKDSAGQIKTYTYNEVNKVTLVSTADDQIIYDYNIKDEVERITNNNVVLQYQRDQKQRIIQESIEGRSVRNFSFDYPLHTINIDYAKNDLRTALSSNFQNITYGYNPNTYQLTSINSSATGSYGFSYDDANRLAQVSRPGSVTNYSYDIGSSLSKISHLKNSTEIGFHEYSYDLRNYITQKRSPASTLSYNYDSNGQLLSSNKSEDSSQNESFSYDALGNRLTYNGVGSSFDNSGQRIQDDGQYTYVYDLNGNVIYKSSKSNGVSYAFEYSALNQLKKATVTSSPLGGLVLKEITYKYDPVGRRILRQVVDNVDSSKSKTQKYYYDGDNILAELDVDNNLTASYTHSPLRADDVLGVKFTSTAVNQGLAESAGFAYYLKDHLNSVNEITNANGDVIQKMDYSAFGVLRSVKNASDQEVGFNNAPVKSSFTYTGREFEPEIGMYYYRARYYDASTGRFLQTDPDPGKLSNPDTLLSKYVYTANNPIMFTDPSGRIFGIFLSTAIFGIFGKDSQQLAFKVLIAGLAMVAGVYTGGAAAGFIGFSAGSVGAAITGTLAGAAGGGLLGAIAFPAAGVGNSEQGFIFGAVFGAIGGFLAGSGYVGNYEVSKYESGKILNGIDDAFSGFIDSFASKGSSKAETIKLISRDSAFAGVLNSIEPYALGIVGGVYVNYTLYNCTVGKCLIPKIPIINQELK